MLPHNLHAVIVNSYIIVHWIEVFYLLNYPIIFQQFPISSYNKYAHLCDCSGLFQT